LITVAQQSGHETNDHTRCLHGPGGPYGPGRAEFFAGRAGPVNLGPYMARRQKMPRNMFICAKAQLCIKSA